MNNTNTNRKPTKFVGLHAHDGFSTFDGLDYPQEHINFVLENGMDALALTLGSGSTGFILEMSGPFLTIETLSAGTPALSISIFL